MISISDEIIDQKKAIDLIKKQSLRDKREAFRRDFGSSMVSSPREKPVAAQRSQLDAMD